MHSNGANEPPLLLALGSLNIVLGVIWFPLLDTIEDVTFMLYGILFANIVVTAHWTWCNSSRLRRYSHFTSRLLRSICSFLLSTSKDVFVPVASSILVVLLKWHHRQSAGEKPPSTYTPRPEIPLTQGTRGKGPIIRPVVQETNTETVVHETRNPVGDRRPTADDAVRDSSSNIPSRSTLPPPSRCNSTDTLVDDPPSAICVPVETCTTASTATSDRDLFAEPIPPPLTNLILHGGRRPDRSQPLYPSMRDLPPHLTITIPTSPPWAHLPDAQFLEAAQLYRDVRTFARERDMYRTRAYQLAMRLDECYSAHAQTEGALENARADLLETRRALSRLEAERRDLSVTLAVILNAARDSTRPESPTEDVQVTEVTPIPSAASLEEEVVVYLRTPGKSTDADERPLLLPPTAETAEGTPTPARTMTWSSDAHSKSRLEAMVLEKRRKMNAARLSSPWDVQRAVLDRPIFSVSHEEIKGDPLVGAEEPERAAEAEAEAEAKAEAKAEADTIFDDLRTNQQRVSPSDTFAVEEKEEQKPEVAAPIAAPFLQPHVQWVTRQPRGPPPSLSTYSVAQPLSNGQTWRGRARDEFVPAPNQSTQYPGLRMPNRMRQATAPAISMTAPAPTPMFAPMMAGPPRVAIAPAAGAIGEERRRHATFGGGGGPFIAPMPPAGFPGPRWPMSVLRNGGVERLRAEAYPFAPSNMFYQAAGGWAPRR